MSIKTYLDFVVCGSKFIVFTLLEEAPFFAFFRLSSFAMIAPLDGVAHGRHSGRISELSWCVDV